MDPRGESRLHFALYKDSQVEINKVLTTMIILGQLYIHYHGPTMIEYFLTKLKSR